MPFYALGVLVNGHLEGLCFICIFCFIFFNKAGFFSLLELPSTLGSTDQCFITASRWKAFIIWTRNTELQYSSILRLQMLSRGCAETLTLLGCVLQSCSLTDQGRNSAAHIHKTSAEERQTCLIDLKEIHGHLKREFYDELRWKKKTQHKH